MSDALYAEIESFVPASPEETQAKQKLLALIREYGDRMLDRDCPAGHITCSGYILSPGLTHTLMAYHLIYGSVGWTGGHADGDPDLPGTALREAREETSVTRIWLQTRRILSIDVLPVPPHEKHGRPVAPHLHYNVTYGLIAPMEQPVAAKPDENRDVRWLTDEKVAAQCTEPQMLPIYQKLTQRMRRIAEEKRRIPEHMPAPLLEWYASSHRDLPWRHDTTPYRVWVSEIMLQQTRVEAVKGYYARFLNALPDVQALAACPEDQLLKLWEGLGYYNRVRNLQKAAQIIVNDYGGVFPQEYAAVRAMPGIGEYTAGAVCSICFGMPTPAVDGNVLRVMARLREDFRNVLDPAVKSEVQETLAAVYPGKDCASLTQALIEIGATVCVPNGMPHCDACPLRTLCMAHLCSSAGMLPVRIKQTKRRTEERTVLVMRCGDRIAIRQRPKKGLLAGLWELPNTGGILNEEQAAALAAEWGVQPLGFEKTVQRRHIFTHITWEMTGIFLTCGTMQEDFVWADAQDLENVYSLPTAFRCILE